MDNVNIQTPTKKRAGNRDGDDENADLDDEVALEQEDEDDDGDDDDVEDCKGPFTLNFLSNFGHFRHAAKTDHNDYYYYYSMKFWRSSRTFPTMLAATVATTQNPSPGWSRRGRTCKRYRYSFHS